MLGDSRESGLCKINALRSRAVHPTALEVSYPGHFPVGVKPKGESHKGPCRSRRHFLFLFFCFFRKSLFICLSGVEKEHGSERQREKQGEGGFQLS